MEIHITKMNSEDYSTDEGSRKRVREEECSSNSAKTSKSPVKQNRRSEEKLDLLIDLVKALKSDTQQIRKEQEECRQEIKKIRDDNKALREENQELKTENKEIKVKLGELSGKIEWLEKEKKKNNVVVMGLKIDTKDPNELKETMESMMQKELEVEVKVKMAHKLGERVCLVEFEREMDKVIVMKNKHKLKNNTSEKIYINDDMTKKEKEKERQIRNLARVEKDKGKEVKVGYNKITINGIEYKWNTGKEKLEEVTKN